MIWKKEAAEKLRQYTSRKAALVSLPQEIRQTELSMDAIRSPGAGSVPTPGASRREDGLLNALALRSELEQSLQQTRLWVENVERAMEVLTQEERLILQRFYITPEPGAADRLAGDLHVDIKTVYRRKDEALRRFTLSLYGVSES